MPHSRKNLPHGMVTDIAPALHRPVKVLIYVEHLIGRGEVQTMIRLLENFDRKLIAPSLLVNRLVGEFLNRVPPDVPIHDLAIRDKRPWRFFLRLRRIVRHANPDVVVGISVSPSRLLNALSLLIPSLRVVCLEENLFRQEGEKGLFALRRMLTAIVHRRASATVVGSQPSADDLVHHLKLAPDQITLIPFPAADPAIFELSKEPAVGVPADDRPLLLNVGNLHPNKGHAVLLRAFAILNQVTRANLLVIGEGPLLADLEALATSLGVAERVRFLGYQQNPYAFMVQADVYVSPSLGESFDIAHIEAMALGLPVVATDAPRFMAIEDGVSGLLVPSSDPGTLAAAILRVLASQDLAEALRRNAPKAVADLTSERVTRQWEALLISTAGL